jgi:hypothetical protein
MWLVQQTKYYWIDTSIANYLPWITRYGTRSTNPLDNTYLNILFSLFIFFPPSFILSILMKHKPLGGGDPPLTAGRKDLTGEFHAGLQFCALYVSSLQLSIRLQATSNLPSSSAICRANRRYISRKKAK